MGAGLAAPQAQFVTGMAPLFANRLAATWPVRSLSSIFCLARYTPAATSTLKKGSENPSLLGPCRMSRRDGDRKNPPESPVTELNFRPNDIHNKIPTFDMMHDIARPRVSEDPGKRLTLRPIASPHHKEVICGFLRDMRIQSLDADVKFHILSAFGRFCHGPVTLS